MQAVARVGCSLLMSIALACATVATAAPASDDGVAIDAVAADALRQAAGHRLLILADLHGTREIPLLVGDIVERIARRGPVTLALEMPQAEQAALDAALDARSATQARRALLARAWWRRSNVQHDGRRSLDMLALIERLRRLRKAGGDVALLAYDVDDNGGGPVPGWRDATMAGRVRAAYRASPSRRLVMLTGNVHAFLRIPSYMQLPTPITTAGMHLADLAPASLRIGATTGQGWYCVHGACGPLPVQAADMPTQGEYTGAVNLPVLHVGRLVTATPAHGH